MIKFINLIVITTCVCINSVHGEIRNGYDCQIAGFRASLDRLTRILEEEDIPFAEKLRIRGKILNLQEGIELHRVTEALIIDFKNIAPELYHQIDTIKNYLGEPVNVYVSLVPLKLMLGQLAATTNLESAENAHQYKSAYGVNTVDVRIASQPRALILLAHEFGHVKYQVPNLATYLNYYQTHYSLDDLTGGHLLGHNDRDPSGQMATFYQRACLQNIRATRTVASPMRTKKVI